MNKNITNNPDGFIIVNNSVESISYHQYLREYGSDETTTPNGIAPRLYVHSGERPAYEHKVSGVMISWDAYHSLTDEEVNDYEQVMETYYEVWTYGPFGNKSSMIQSFYDEEEAQLFIYECWSNNVEKNCNAPAWWETYEEAVSDLALIVDKRVEVVTRWLSISDMIRKREQQHAEAARQEQEQKKSKLAIAVKSESEILIIDDEFVKGIKWASEVSGIEKNNRHASVMKGLLQRNGIEQIKSDFWQVFRILKSKAI